MDSEAYRLQGTALCMGAEVRWKLCQFLPVGRLCSGVTSRARAVLITTSAAGLRVGAVVRLHLTDLESDRMLIHVNQGTGRKDRSTLLSAHLLAALRASWKLYRPALWLFPGKDTTQPMPIATAQKFSYQPSTIVLPEAFTPGDSLRRYCTPFCVACPGHSGPRSAWR